MAFVNIPGNVNPVKVLSATGTSAGTITFVHDLGVEGNYPGELYPAVFIFAITDIVGSFSALQVNIEWSPITPDVGAAQFQTVGTWTPLMSPVVYFACSTSGLYRLNCTSFIGGTSFNAYVSIASTMPQGTGGGGGGSVTQGTTPWADNVSQVAGVALGATAVVNYGSTPAAVPVPGVNAFVTNAGSIGDGVQFSDNAASGATPTGTLDMGWDSVNSKIRALKVDTSQNLLVALGVALPAGTNVIGHVIVDSGTITVNGSVSISGNVGVTQQTTPWTIQGDSASGAAKAGNPVQIGGVFNTNQPTVTTGQTVEAQATSHGAQIVATGVDNFTVFQGGGWAVDAVQSGGWTVAATQNGGWTVSITGTVEIVGNSGNVLDSLTGVSITPTSALAVSAAYIDPAPSLVTGESVALQCDTTGSLYVNEEGRKQTFRAVSVAQTIIASATAPTFSLQGSSIRTVRIRKIRISVSAATGSVADVSLRRLSALSGGTSATITLGALDKNNAIGGGNAVAQTWSVAATTATSAGVLASQRYEIVTAGVSTQPGFIEWTFGDTNEQSCVLRGTSDFVGILFSAVGTTPLADIWIEWTEE